MALTEWINGQWAGIQTTTIINQNPPTISLLYYFIARPLPCPSASSTLQQFNVNHSITTTLTTKLFFPCSLSLSITLSDYNSFIWFYLTNDDYPSASHRSIDRFDFKHFVLSSKTATDWQAVVIVVVVVDYCRWEDFPDYHKQHVLLQSSAAVQQQQNSPKMAKKKRKCCCCVCRRNVSSYCRL